MKTLIEDKDISSFETNTASLKECLDEFIFYLETECCIDLNLERDIRQDDDFTGFDVNLGALPYYIASTVKKAFIELLRRSHLGDSQTNLINSVLMEGINETCMHFIRGDEIALEILNFYMQYLKNSELGVITPSIEAGLYNSYTWLRNLQDNKGFTTINDYARKVLESIFLMALESGLHENEEFEFIDKYFNSNVFDHFIEIDAPNFYSDELILLFKKYQIRLLYADLYRKETARSLYNEDAPSNLSTFLEKIIKNRAYSLPSNKEFRYALYRSFEDEMSEKFISFEQSVLKGSDKIQVLKESNPLYFLDK